MMKLKSVLLFLLIVCSSKTDCMQGSLRIFDVVKRNKKIVIIGLIYTGYMVYQVLSRIPVNILQRQFFHQDLKSDKEEKEESEYIPEPFLTQEQLDEGLKASIFSKDFGRVKSFLDKGAKVTRKILFEALKSDLKIFKLIIDRDGKYLPQKLKNMYLQYALQIEKNADLTLSLINSKAGVNMLDCCGRPLLQLAVEEEQPEIVDLLIKKGADINFMITVKHIFTKDEHMSVLFYLISKMKESGKKGIIAKRYAKCIQEALGQCVICLEDNKIGNGNLVITSCRHLFHENCLFKWTSRNATCPVCKSLVQSNLLI